MGNVIWYATWPAGNIHSSRNVESGVLATLKVAPLASVGLPPHLDTFVSNLEESRSQDSLPAKLPVHSFIPLLHNFYSRGHLKKNVPVPS